MQRITELDNHYPGQTLWVIGRGPSLARLAVEDIGPGPVIAINQAISKVEELNLSNPVYSMQKDQALIECKAPILSHAHESAKDAQFGDFVFDAIEDFGYPWHIPSVVVCSGLALRWGCDRIVYLCCDAAFGDLGTYGYPPSYPQNYLLHKPLVQRYARLPMEWKRI